MKYNVVKRPHEKYPYHTDHPYGVENAETGIRFGIDGVWAWDTQEAAEKALKGFIKSLTKIVVATYEV